MLVRVLPFLLLLAGCPDPTAAPEGGGMSDKPMGGGDAQGQGMGQGGQPGAEGGQPGGPGGQGQGQGGPPPGGGRPTPTGFTLVPGQTVKLHGTVAYTGTKTGTFTIDFLRQAEGSAFPDLVYSQTQAAPGPWEVEVPKDAGTFMIVCFLDANGNGPDPGEPAARVQDPVKIGSADISDLKLELSDNPDLGDLKPGGKDGAGGQGMPPGGAPGGQGGPPGGEQGMAPGGAGAAPGGAVPGGGAPGMLPPDGAGKGEAPPVK